MYINSRINKNTIEPVIAIGMTWRFGQPLLDAFTKLTMEIIKHGTKTANMAIIMKKTIAAPKTNNPTNPMA